MLVCVLLWLATGFCWSQTIAPEANLTCVGKHCAAKFLYTPPGLSINQILPKSGPIEGGTTVIIFGTGFREFGDLMKCKFGPIEVPAQIFVPYGDVFDPFLGEKISCLSPSVLSPRLVSVEVSLTGGETYTSAGFKFTYFEHPTLSFVTNTNGTNDGEEITILGSGFDQPLPDYTLVCRFQTPVLSSGNGQVSLDKISPAILHSDEEISCSTPASTIHGPILIQVSLNGKDFTPLDPNFFFNYTDDWRVSSVSGTPPVIRTHHSAALVGCQSAAPSFKGCRVVVYGGFNGAFLSDFTILQLDVFSEAYQSSVNLDWVWTGYTAELGLSSGINIGGRAHHTATAVKKDLYIFGGLEAFDEESLNTMFRLDENLKLSPVFFDKGATSIDAPARSEHSMTYVVLDGDDYLLLYGGKSVIAIPGFEGNSKLNYPLRFRYKYSREMYLFNVDTRVWTLIMAEDGYDEQFYARAGHSADAFEGLLYVFGGDAFVPNGNAGSNTYVSDTTVFDIATRTWSASRIENNPPTARAYHSSFIYKHYLFVFGGIGTAGPLNDLWYIDTTKVLSGTKWILVSLSGTGPPPSYGIDALVLPSLEVLFWGGTGNGDASRDLYLLNLDSQNL
eukprot:c20013_g1_i1.p1 GENE.c20013_g1_i1~~c20013_g1_i1.p1  ORF type:complete len:617 (+),score=87.44 c20013_g1_i1:49-1899(+)